MVFDAAYLCYLEPEHWSASALDAAVGHQNANGRSATTSPERPGGA